MTIGRKALPFFSRWSIRYAAPVKPSNIQVSSSSFGDMTSELLSGFRPAIERAGLRLIVDCSPLPEPVWVDTEMWEKIVLNLLSNALRFTFSGEIAVRLHARPNHIELTVRDTGIGIPKAYLPHLFERFYRVPGNHGRTSEGSGIGLALVDELVRLHQGAMRVQSQPGVGSLFTVWLPRRPRRLPEQWSEAPAHSTTTGVAPFLEEASQWARDEPDRLAGQLLPSVEPLSARSPGARVLVADDNADIRDYLRRLLGQYWTVETVADGQEALVALGRGVPDLLLADVMMPNLDGFTLLRMMRGRQDLASLPIILLTARAGEETAIEGLLAGADDYVTKPFSARELVARVGAQLELGRMRNRSEAQIRLLATASSDMLYKMSPDWSEKRYLSGRNFIVDTTSPSRSWLETYILPEDQPQVLAAIQQAIRTKSTFELEHRVILVDGTAGWTFSRAIPLLDEHGEIVEWLGAASNVTERKQAEETLRRQNEQLQAQVREGTAALRESEERLRTLVETAPLTIWSADAQGRVVEGCPAFRAFTRQIREEWLGSGWLHAIHPDDRHYAEAQWRRAVETHTPVNAEFVCAMRAGSGAIAGYEQSL